MAIAPNHWSGMDLKRLQMYLTDLGETQISMFSNFCHVVKKALKNSFEVGKKYLRSFVKSELIRLHTKFGVKHPKAITAETINDYFNVIDTVRIGNSKAIYIISPKI